MYKVENGEHNDTWSSEIGEYYEKIEDFIVKYS